MNEPMKIQSRPKGQATLVILCCALLTASTYWTATALAESGAEQFDAQMQPILRSYLKVGDALAADSLKGVRAEAERIHKLAGKLNPSAVTGEHASHYEDVPAKLESASAALAKTKTLEEARSTYKKLSMPMGMWASMSKPKGVNVVYCPMAKGSWLQEEGAIRNPYYGSSMLGCGQVVKGE